MALIEDDVVAMDGWLHKTKQAIDEVERKTQQQGKNKSDCRRLATKNYRNPIADMFSFLPKTLLYRRISRLEQGRVAKLLDLVTRCSLIHRCQFIRDSPVLLEHSQLFVHSQPLDHLFHFRTS